MYLSSLTFAKEIKIVVLTVVRTASTYLNSLMLVKVRREKATGFGGSYREIIMKKFRIFYQTKLGGLCLWFYYSGHFLKKAYDFISK